MLVTVGAEGLVKRWLEDNLGWAKAVVLVRRGISSTSVDHFCRIFSKGLLMK